MAKSIRRRPSKRVVVPEFKFQTNALRGVKQDTPAERAEKDRLVAEFLAKQKARGEFPGPS